MRINLVAIELVCASSLAGLLTLIRVGASLPDSFLLSYAAVAILLVVRRTSRPVSAEVPQEYFREAYQRAILWALGVVGVVGVGGFLFTRDSRGSAGLFVLGLVLLAAMLGSLELLTRIDRFRLRTHSSAGNESKL